MSEEYYLITFENTHAAIATEKLLAPADVRIMPVPRFISASCGISVRIKPECYTLASEIFQRDGRLKTDEYAIYHVIKDSASGEVKCDRLG